MIFRFTSTSSKAFCLRSPPFIKVGPGGHRVKNPPESPFEKGGTLNTAYPYACSMKNISIFPESSNAGSPPAKPVVYR
jgi:hypothetical protein